IRARRTWPRSSVPSGCDHDGVLSLALKSISLTGTRHTSGPATTARTIAKRTAAPTVASRWRRKRRPVSRQSEGAGSAATVTSFPATVLEAAPSAITGPGSARPGRTGGGLREARVASLDRGPRGRRTLWVARFRRDPAAFGSRHHVRAHQYEIRGSSQP